MSLTQGKKNIDTMKESGNGERDGEVERWQNKELEELAEQLTDIVIDSTPQHFMPTLWKNIPFLKSVNYH